MDELEFKTDARKAFTIKLVRSRDAVKELQDHEMSCLQEFHPEYTYALFGESESIYGYKGLSIDLQFASGSLRPFLNIAYSELLPKRSTVKPDDVQGILHGQLPDDVITDAQEFDKAVQDDQASFKPIGECIGGYARKWVVPTTSNGASPKSKGKQKARVPDSDDEDEPAEPHWAECEPDEEGAVIFEAWFAPQTTPGIEALHRRMQVFVPLLIEGGSFIEEGDPHWEYVVLYEKRKLGSKNTYHFVGYTTLYRFFHYPDKIRLRLSQFIILPPYQRSGHGTHLYNMVYIWMLGREEVDEWAVEDPAEEFQDMRDKTELEILMAQDAVVKLPLDKELIEETRVAMKLAKLQFSRVLEMAIMLKFGDLSTARDNKEFRVAVKERLYRHNYDQLQDLPLDERKVCLSKTFDSVLDDYVRILTGGQAEEDSEDDEPLMPPPSKRRKLAAIDE